MPRANEYAPLCGPSNWQSFRRAATTSILARALAQQSDLYLMDEPFEGVDAVTEKAIVELLKNLRDQKKTLLIVHHDLSTTKEYFDQLLLLNMRKVAFGPIAEVYTHELLQKTYGGKLTVLSEMATETARNSHA